MNRNGIKWPARKAYTSPYLQPPPAMAAPPPLPKPKLKESVLSPTNCETKTQQTYNIVARILPKGEKDTLQKGYDAKKRIVFNTSVTTTLSDDGATTTSTTCTATFHYDDNEATYTCQRQLSQPKLQQYQYQAKQPVQPNQKHAIPPPPKPRASYSDFKFQSANDKMKEREFDEVEGPVEFLWTKERDDNGERFLFFRWWTGEGRSGWICGYAKLESECGDGDVKVDVCVKKGDTGMKNGVENGDREGKGEVGDGDETKDKNWVGNGEVKDVKMRDGEVAYGNVKTKERDDRELSMKEIERLKLTRKERFGGGVGRGEW